MKNLCSCYGKLKTNESRILVRTHSFLHHNTLFTTVYCAQCGKPSFIDENVLIIDIEELNVPLNVIVEELKVVKKILISRKTTPTTIQLYNIILAIVWAYEVDYYQKFDNYLFGDVRDAIISYFIDYNPTLNKSFLEDESIYDAYLKYVEDTLLSKNCKPFDLENALSDPNIFTSANHALYGPASLVHGTYVNTCGIEKKTNNAYYPDDKYFRNNYSQLKQEAEHLYLAIKHAFCMYLVSKCDDFSPYLFYEVDTFQDLKRYVLAHSSSNNRLIVTGFLNVFEDILDTADNYLCLTSRTYKDYLKELQRAEAYVNEHLM